jgi:hypothetical protein
MALRTCRRHAGPNQATSLLTNRPETVTAREMVGLYRHRWWSELWCKALHSVVGLGQPLAHRAPFAGTARAWEVVQAQVERSARQTARKWFKMGNTT